MKTLLHIIAAVLVLSVVAIAFVGDIEETPQAKQMAKENAKKLAEPKIGAQIRYDGKGKTPEEAFEKACDKLLKSEVKHYKLNGITTSIPQDGHPYYWCQLWIIFNR